MADLQILHCLVGCVLIIGAKCGRSTLGLLGPLHRVLLERNTLASAVGPEGGAVLPLDGVEDGVGILIGQDRVGRNRQAVLGATDAQGSAQLFQQAGLLLGGPEQVGKNFAGRTQRSRRASGAEGGGDDSGDEDMDALFVGHPLLRLRHSGQ